MPPHCDAMDGPVVKAARRALEAGDVKLVLPFLHEDGEDEVRQAFAKVLDLTRDGAAAREVAELYFFETVVRFTGWARAQRSRVSSPLGWMLGR